MERVGAVVREVMIKAIGFSRCSIFEGGHTGTVFFARQAGTPSTPN
jgi:hypothetical protein